MSWIACADAEGSRQMPCIIIPLGDGNFARAYVRMSKPRPKKCSVCGKMNASYQCDFPTPTLLDPNKTCDAFLCAACLVPVGPDTDYCPHHPHPRFPEAA